MQLLGCVGLAGLAREGFAVLVSLYWGRSPSLTRSLFAFYSCVAVRLITQDGDRLSLSPLELTIVVGSLSMLVSETNMAEFGSVGEWPCQKFWEM